MSLWSESALRQVGKDGGQIVKESWVYHLCAVIAAVLGRWMRGSLIFNFMTGQRVEEPQNTLSRRLRDRASRLQAGLWTRLHLDRILQGSMFQRVGFWCALPVILAPLVPTMVVLALVLAGFASLILTMGCKPGLRLHYSPVNKWVVLYACIYVFATCTSVTPRGSLFVGMIGTCFLLYYLVVCTAIRSWSGVRRLIFWMIGAGLLVTLYGFWQFLHPELYNSTWLDTDMFSSITLRVYSTLANPNVLGTYLLLLIPFTVAMCLTAPGIWKKLCYGGVALMMMLCLVLTYSRGCYLGLLFAAAIFLVLLDRRFLALGLILLVLSPLYLPENILNRFTSIGDMGDSSTSYRVYIWMGTLRMMKDYWFSGIGPGEAAFHAVYPVYALDGISAPHPHNLFLQILCDSGVVGLTMFVAMIGSFFRALCTGLRRTKSKEVRIFQMAAISAVAGFLLEGMTDYTFYNYRVTFLFWAILGLGALIARGDSLKRENLAGQTPWTEECAPDGTGKIRVLNIISDTNIGGAGRTLLNYMKYCDRSKYTVTVLVPRGSKLKPALEALDTNVLEADIQGDRSLDLRAIPKLRAMVAAAEPDVVHTHGSMSGRIAARGSHAKLIYSRHSAFPVPDNMKHGPRHWVNRLVNELYADRIISVSPATMENLTDSGVRENQIDIVMNGVDAVPPATAEVQQAWRERLGLRNGDFVVGILARLEEYKGHLILLEAAAKLREQGYPLRVLIAGTGDYEETVRQRMNELELEGTVQMLGFTTQVAEFLSVLDVQINCSYGTEATSLSLLEGFSMGLPAVVSNYGGNPWLVTNGENGMIFENRDVDGLVQCLKTLMDQPELLPGMREKAKQAYETRFTGQIFAKNIEAEYQLVLEK